MITITYHPIKGNAFRDGNIDYEIDYLIRQQEKHSAGDIHYITASELFILAFRAAVKQKRFMIDQVKLMFEGQQLKLDQDGTIDNWPKGFADKSIDYMMILLDWED